jgi:hypothetical protein
MERWSRDAAPRYESLPPDEIPLQTPMGSYSKPWWKKHGWTLGPIVTIVVIGLIAAFFTPDPKGSPTLIFHFRTDGGVPLETSTDQMKAWIFVKDQPREMGLFLTNRGNVPAQVRVASSPESVNGVNICWRLRSSDRCGTTGSGPLGVLAPGERQAVTVTITADNSDSSQFDITVYFASTAVSASP